jgi:hypothetical protein
VSIIAAADGIWLARAQQLRERKPVAIKDPVGIARMVTTCGSALFAEHVPTRAPGGRPAGGRRLRITRISGRTARRTGTGSSRSAAVYQPSTRTGRTPAYAADSDVLPERSSPYRTDSSDTAGLHGTESSGFLNRVHKFDSCRGHHTVHAKCASCAGTFRWCEADRCSDGPRLGSSGISPEVMPGRALRPRL